MRGAKVLLAFHTTSGSRQTIRSGHEYTKIRKVFDRAAVDTGLFV
jgi:hypothetical protein